MRGETTPAEAVRHPSARISCIRTQKDGKMLRKTDTRRLYAPSYFGLEPESFESCVLETPLGEGDVPWARYIAALKEIGYDGWLTIERECGDDPAADIAAAAKFLKKYL